MLHKGFEKFVNALALVWVSDETFTSIFKSLEINPTDWPKCTARDLVNEYERLWPQIGHLKTKRALAPSIADLAKKADTDLIPSDINSIRSAYDSFFFLQRAVEVGVQISDHPENAFEIFAKLQTPGKSQSELFDVAEISKCHHLRLSEDAFKGQMVKEIAEWPELSKMIAGFNPGRLGMILAESGYGKSNFCLNLALSAQKSMRVVYFNMEMLIEDMMDRVHVILSGMSWSDLKKGAVPSYEPIASKLVNGNFLMSNGTDKSLDQIRLTVQRLNQEKKVDLVVVDYDQKILLKTDSKTPEWKALQDAFVGLETLAKDYQCYVLVAAQSSNDEGKVSGSLRSKFPCSTVLFFHDHPVHGPIISVKKNRFESIKQFLKVDYNPQSSTVKERELVHASPEKADMEGTIAGTKRVIRVTPTSLPYAD
jgi:hypothetical protein